MSPAQRLHPHTSWVFGVVVALAIQEALLKVVAHLVTPSTDLPSWQMALETWRLGLFLVVTIRFYLGSAVFYSDAYIDTQEANPNYGIDFACSTVHFLSFLAWATTITVHVRYRTGLSPFEAFLAFILSFDLLWLAISRNTPTFQRIKLWTAINAGTIGLCAVILLVCGAIGLDAVFSEQAMFVPVAFVSLVDIGGLISGRNIFKDWLAKLI